MGCISSLHWRYALVADNQPYLEEKQCDQECYALLLDRWAVPPNLRLPAACDEFTLGAILEHVKRHLQHYFGKMADD